MLNNRGNKRNKIKENNMSIKYSILIEQLEVFISSKKQIDRILHDYENEIKNIVNEIKKHDPSVENIYKLFSVQNDLSALLYKYNYPLSDYLRDFIYEFDRQDEESVFYLIKEIVENKNFLNYG